MIKNQECNKLNKKKDDKIALINAHNSNTTNQIKRILKLATPSVFSNLIVYSLETINLIFAGKVENKSAYSNSDIINSIGMGNIFMNFGGFLFGLGIISSLETLCSQSYGKRDFKEMSKWVVICNVIMTIYFILLGILCFNSDKIIIYLGQTENIAKLSYIYLTSLIPAFLFQFYTASYTKFLNAQQIYNPVLYINLICLLFHPFWCFLFYSTLKMGILGLGIAYDLTSFLMLLFTYLYIQYHKLSKKVNVLSVSLNEWISFTKISLECGILASIDTIGFEILSFLSSFLQQNQLDANICVINIYNNIYSVSLGFGTTLTTLVGNFMGENKPLKAKQYAKLGIFVNFSVTVSISLCCVIFHNYIALIYMDDLEILEISSKLIRIVGIFIIFDAIHIQLTSILRGIGKQLVGMIIGIILFIFIQTFMCYTFMSHFELGVYGIWFGQIICAMLASIIFTILISKIDWEAIAIESSAGRITIKDEELHDIKRFKEVLDKVDTLKFM
jgi:MATE family multidrug resistance protein